MGIFSLDIDKFYEDMQETGHQIKGIFCLQYPIYCIHANITDSTPDPLDSLDKLIVDFVSASAGLTSLQIAALMGTSKSLIDLRISKMLYDRLLIQEGERFTISAMGIEVFREKSQIRLHKLSYDFYVDGITLKPLPKIFYTYYASKLVSEHDSYYHTNPKGESRLVRPFGPDIVHTPPNQEHITNNIFSITERDNYSIPNGLQEINNTSFTKLSLHLLVSVSANGADLKKELIDGFAYYSLMENISYHETIRRNVKLFENQLLERIKNLEFKISFITNGPISNELQKPMLTTNWHETDKYQDSANRCFSFSTDDLIKVVEQIFQIKHVVKESIVNENNEIVISINKKMLLSSDNRKKLINDLIRERDYKFGFPDNNVFLLYLYYKTADEFVKSVVRLVKSINQNRSHISLSWIFQHHPEFRDNYRQLLTAAGEFELLEKLDIGEHMLSI